MLMFVQTDEGARNRPSPVEQRMPAIEWWFGEQAGRFLGGNQLQPARTATTVRWKGTQPVVTDGPFLEAKEVIGGYGIFEAPDRDATIAIAKTWASPEHHAVEIRPVAERGARG